MAIMMVAASFTRNAGDDPATGLALSDIDFYLYAINRATGAETEIWNGTQNPTAEVTNVGTYIRFYATANFSTYDYVAAAKYNGAVSLDAEWVTGIGSETHIMAAGAIEFTYTVVDGGGVPIEGVEVWFATDIAGTNIVWYGTTDAFGVTRDVNDNLPWLDAGTYYVWRQRAGYVFTNPDTEIVS